MKEGQKLWTRSELILALNLYYKTPFSKLHKGNLEVIHLAELIGRSVNAVAYKLVNFASLDPSLQARGIKAATNTSELDKMVWREFYDAPDVLPFESEKLLAEREHTSVEALNDIPEVELPKEGKERERIVRVRVNQAFFRKTILASYDGRCCITGISQKELLVAGHILPWGKDVANRLNPRNGIAINALHDKAFEAGFLTITPDFIIQISSEILRQDAKANKDFFHAYHGKPMILPQKFRPDPKFLLYHNQERFTP